MDTLASALHSETQTKVVGIHVHTTPSQGHRLEVREEDSTDRGEGSEDINTMV